MTAEQKRQLDELLKLQRLDERRERDRQRRDAERYVKKRWGLTFSELDALVREKDRRTTYSSTSYM